VASWHRAPVSAHSDAARLSYRLAASVALLADIDPAEEVEQPLEGFRPERVRDTSLSEAAFVGASSEAARGGPLAAVVEGDTVTLDVPARELRLEVDEGTVAARLAGWRPPAPRIAGGVLAKYAVLVGSASEGAVTGPRLAQ